MWSKDFRGPRRSSHSCAFLSPSLKTSNLCSLPSPLAIHASTMSAIAAVRSIRAPAALAGKRASPAAGRRASSVAVRAVTEKPSETIVPSEEAPVADNTVFYRGRAYSEAEYDAAKASGEINDLSKVEVAVYAEPPTFGGEGRCSLFFRRSKAKRQRQAAFFCVFLLLRFFAALSLSFSSSSSSSSFSSSSSAPSSFSLRKKNPEFQKKREKENKKNSHSTQTHLSLFPFSVPLAPSLPEIMAFSGPAPEALNGRLCMLGLLAGVAAELATGKSVPEQFSQEPTLVVATALIFAAATFAPLISNVDVVAPAGFVRNVFTSKAETANGRAAMVGFGSLLLIEAVKGSALF